MECTYLGTHLQGASCTRRAPSREFRVGETDVKRIRTASGLSQAKFARLLHVEIGTLRNREQGRRTPTGPAQVLLRAIDRNPRAVLRAIRCRAKAKTGCGSRLRVRNAPAFAECFISRKG